MAIGEFDRKAETVRAIVAEAFPGLHVKHAPDDLDRALIVGMELPTGRRIAFQVMPVPLDFDERKLADRFIDALRSRMEPA